MAGILGQAASIGGVIVAGRYLSGKLKGIIDHAQATVKDILAQINRDIDRLIDNLEETYQDNLNLSLDKLDAFTRNKLLEIEQLFETINKGVQEDVNLITRNVQDSLQKATLELEQSIKKTVFIAGETAVYAVDRVTYNLLLIIALSALAVGLVAFPWVILKTGLPGGAARIVIFALMGLWLLFFGALVLIPRFRGSIIRFTGIGLKARIDTAGVSEEPSIVKHDPEVLEVGLTKEMVIWGVNLEREGQLPKASVAGREVNIIAHSSDTLVLSLEGLEFSGDSGSYNLVLRYENGPEVREVLQILVPQPPSNLRISHFSLSSNQPVKGELVTATIEVQNDGSGDITDGIPVQWAPTQNDTNSPQSYRINGLKAGEKDRRMIHYTYNIEGKFTSLVTVDPTFAIPETNESDNTRTLEIDVIPPPKVENGLYIYFDAGLQGPPKLIEEDVSHLKNISDHNDKVSSLKLVGDKEAIVYEHGNFEGRAKLISQRRSVVDKGELKDQGFDDVITSIKIRNQGSLSGITIYEHKNYRGKSTFLSGRNYTPPDLMKLGFVRTAGIGSSYSSTISSLEFHSKKTKTVTLVIWPNKKVTVRGSSGDGIVDLQRFGIGDRIIAIEM